jgi:hypothetical protein
VGFVIRKWAVGLNIKKLFSIQCDSSIFDKVFIWCLGQPVQWFGQNQKYLKLKLGALQFIPGIKNLNVIFFFFLNKKYLVGGLPAILEKKSIL